MLKNSLEQNHIFAPEPPENFSQNKKEQLNKDEARESQIKAVGAEKSTEDESESLIYYLEETKQITLTVQEKKWLKMLARDGVLTYQDGYIIFDYKQYSQPRFTHKYYIGPPDDRPTRQMFEKILTDVKFILKSDYEQGKVELLDFNILYFRQKRQQFIERLTASGVLEKKEGWLICDLEKIKDLDLTKLLPWFSRHRLKRAIPRSRIGIFQLLGDLKVVSKADYAKNKLDRNFQLKAKPLFNVPASLDEAFDIEKIKKADYYLNYWDINSKNSTPKFNATITAKNGQEIEVKELYLATKIYRDYNGRRIKNKNGDDILVVWDKQKEKYVKISFNWLTSGTVFKSRHPSLLASDGIHNFLLKHCPNLLRRGLIKLSDFEILTTGKSGRLLRKEFLFKKGERREAVYIGSVGYYIGRKYFIYNHDRIPVKNIKISVLDPKTAGIIVKYEGREELKYVFDLLGEEEKKQRIEAAREKFGRKRVSANIFLTKKEMAKRLRPYSVAEIIRKKPGESDEEYEKRRAQISDYGYVNRIAKKFSYECGIGIHNLSWREQVWLAAAAYDFGIRGKEKELLLFAREYGLPGLKAFLALEEGEMSGEDILNISRQLKNQPQAASRLFTEFARIVDNAEKDTEELIKMYNEIFFDKKLNRDKANYAILKKAFALLSRAKLELAVAEEKDKKEIVTTLITDLKRAEKAQKLAIKNLKDLIVVLNNKYNDISDRLFYEELSDEESTQLKKVKKQLQAKNRRLKALEFDRLQEFKSKYDSKEVKSLLDYYNFTCQRVKEAIEDMPDLKNFPDDKAKVWKKTIDRYTDYYTTITNIKNKLTELYLLQQSLEQKLDEFVYGRQPDQDLPPDAREHISYQVLQKYDEIIELAQAQSQEFKKIFKAQKNFSDQELDRLTENLLTRAKNFLFDFSNKVINKEISEEEILSELESYRADLILTASVWKAIEKKGLKLEDLKGVSFEKTTVEDLTKKGQVLDLIKSVLNRTDKFPSLPGESFQGAFSEFFAAYDKIDQARAEEILQMFKIYYDNYKAKPELQKELIRNFYHKLKQGQDKIIIYLYKKANKDGQENVIAFNRFDIISPKKRYFGSFNVLPSVANSAIGTALLKVSLAEQKQAAKEIEADCEPEKFISSLYIEKYGFAVEKIIPNYAQTGITAFNIVWRPENSKLYYRDYEQADIIREYEQNFASHRWQSGDKFLIIKFADKNKRPLNTEAALAPLLKKITPLVNEKGYVISRYFFANKQKEVYCALEKGGS